MLLAAASCFYQKLFPTKYKERHELRYWNSRVKAERTLTNDHYCYFYTDYFGINQTYYDGKKILDIGCGPRGSLEWARNASERIGLDTLANEYMGMGASSHHMQYIDGMAEAIPFPADHFDVVCSFNSLDHVSNLELALENVYRVLQNDGIFLLIVETHHQPTATEPVQIEDVSATFGHLFNINGAQEYEIGSSHDIYGQLRRDDQFDHSNSTPRARILTATLTKKLKT